MQAPKYRQHALTLVCTLVLALCAADALAKKDLFAADPAEKTATHQQQLVMPATTEETKTSEKLEAPAKPENQAKPSFLSSQFKRLQLNISETTDKLLGKSTQPKSLTADSQSSISAPINNLNTPTNSAETTSISSTEAAQRAQKIAEGKVMNVKKYQEGDKAFYTVKLLQNNGRMKTVNLDAETGQEAEQSSPPTE